MPIIFGDGATNSVQNVKGGQYHLLGGIDTNGSTGYYGPYIIESYNNTASKYRYLEINPRSGQQFIQLSSGTAPVTSYIKVDTSSITVTSSTVNINGSYQTSGTVTTTNATPTALIDLSTDTNSAYVVWGYVIGEHNTGATAAVGGRVEGVFRNASGTLVSVGVAATVYEDLSGTPTFALTTSGVSIRLQVTGLAGQTIAWYGNLYYMKT